MQTREFWLGKRFEDRKKFPYGFSRSGDFTIKQSEILEKYGYLMSALVAGDVSDPNEEDKAFLEALEKWPDTDHPWAKIWHKYKSINRHLITASSSCKEVVDMDDDEIFDAENDDIGDWDEDVA